MNVRESHSYCTKTIRHSALTLITVMILLYYIFTRIKILYFSFVLFSFCTSHSSHSHIYSINPFCIFLLSPHQCLFCLSSRPNGNSIQVIIYQGGQVFSLANHLNGRVGFVATMPSTSASIFINNTQLSDTGTYQCLVNNLPDRGGRNIGVIGLTVLGNYISG